MDHKTEDVLVDPARPGDPSLLYSVLRQRSLAPSYRGPSEEYPSEDITARCTETDEVEDAMLLPE